MGKRKFWTKEEIKNFIELYPETPMIELIKIFKRNKQSLIQKAHKLKIQKIIKNGSVAFTKEEIEKIIFDSKTISVVNLSKKYNRDESTISSVLKRNKISPVKNDFWWTEDEELFLINNYNNFSTKELENKLNRNRKTITKKARLIGLKRMNNSGEFRKNPSIINEKESLYILENHDKLTTVEIARNLGRKSVDIILFCKRNNLSFIRGRKDLNNFSDKKLLNELIEMSKELGRCPNISEISNNINLPAVDIYFDRFGSFTNACEKAGLIPNIGRYGTQCYSKNHDFCYSIQEQIITDYFIDNNIQYIKEYPYSKIIKNQPVRYIMDWLINENIVVEYFGMINDKEYNKKTKEKIKICKNNNIKIISIFPKDLKILSKKFLTINKNP